VSEIVVHGGKVQGVRLADGREILTDRVISAAGAAVTSRMLDDGAIAVSSDDAVMGPAHLSLYIGFEGDVARHGGARYSQWFYETWDTERDLWDIAYDAEPGRADVLYCSFPSLKDPLHDPGPHLRQTGEVITFVAWEPFTPWLGTRWKKRGEEYDEFKENLSQALLAQYLENYPELAPMVKFTELSTPLSTHHFARSRSVPQRETHTEDPGEGSLHGRGRCDGSGHRRSAGWWGAGGSGRRAGVVGALSALDHAGIVRFSGRRRGPSTGSRRRPARRRFRRRCRCQPCWKRDCRFP